MKRKSKKTVAPEPTRYEMETFRQVGSWQMGQMKQDHPDCFNGRVSVRKWRVVAELIDEPKEVIAERIRKLWRENDNHHNAMPLMAAAKEVGIELLLHECGAFRKRP